MRIGAKQMALGGMLIAVAVVIMCMGSMIPVNTYVCPVLCILMTRPVILSCGKRIAWCYYMAVGILGLMLAPDKEAAAVYVFLGYYPMIKPFFDRLPGKVLPILGKGVLFTLAGAAVYWLLLAVIGLETLQAEFQGMGAAAMFLLLVVWDFLFLMVDRLLGMKYRKK